MNIHGIIPAMVTPFDSDEQLNEPALRQLVNYLIDGGVHALFPVGSQGEFYALTIEEKRRTLEVVLDEAHGRVPVYAGTGAITTQQVIELNRMAEDIGVAAVSVLTPFFISPSEEELYHHFVSVADATSLPVLLYNNPGRTGGLNLSANLVDRLARHPNIAGIKDSSGDLSLTTEFIRRTGDDFAVLLGRDTLIYAGLLHGAAGAVAATSNVAPALVVRIYESFKRGDLDGALTAQNQLAALRNAFSLGTFPVVIKEALELIGIPVGPARSPVGPMQEAPRQKLKSVLTELGLI